MSGGVIRPGNDGLDWSSQDVHNLARPPIEMVDIVYSPRFETDEA